MNIYKTKKKKKTRKKVVKKDVGQSKKKNILKSRGASFFSALFRFENWSLTLLI